MVALLLLLLFLLVAPELLLLLPPLLCDCSVLSIQFPSEPFLFAALKLGAFICAAVGVVGVTAPVSLEAFELSSVNYRNKDI